ncbi:hypothetical protein DOTSEDRAFT_75417 [Dothistroma septosporum NZE10]|uniref:RRM domain-containing protein n=1 Tax=Dothistroma septosporum (strain NZE10 / CBS 128990) TaxID=675120 RepID=M2YI79_DOTSN|nr:hypothetical protein DOTSEDRAFT_75417 [Dothistroma septosporum NZE10]
MGEGGGANVPLGSKSKTLATQFQMLEDLFGAMMVKNEKLEADVKNATLQAKEATRKMEATQLENEVLRKDVTQHGKKLKQIEGKGSKPASQKPDQSCWDKQIEGLQVPLQAAANMAIATTHETAKLKKYIKSVDDKRADDRSDLEHKNMLADIKMVNLEATVPVSSGDVMSSAYLYALESRLTQLSERITPPRSPFHKPIGQVLVANFSETSPYSPEWLLKWNFESDIGPVSQVVMFHQYNSLNALALVQFEDADHATRAHTHDCRSFIWTPTKIEVKEVLYLDGGTIPSSRQHRVVVTGLPIHYSLEDVQTLLRSTLRPFAGDDDQDSDDTAMLSRDAQGQFTGHAIVQPEDAEDIGRLVRLLDEKVLDGSELRVGIVEDEGWVEGFDVEIQGLERLRSLGGSEQDGAQWKYEEGHCADDWSTASSG